MSPVSTPLITALKELLRAAGVSENDIENVGPAPPEPNITAPDQRQAVALARRLGQLREQVGNTLGACQFIESGLHCLLNTTRNDCTVIGQHHGGSNFSTTTGEEKWVP
jgi:hypothetical protein